VGSGWRRNGEQCAYRPRRELKNPFVLLPSHTPTPLPRLAFLSPSPALARCPSPQVGKVKFVDLAGSECIARSGTSKEEAGPINVVCLYPPSVLLLSPRFAHFSIFPCAELQHGGAKLRPPGGV